jgi:hypothetical protein
MRQLIVSAERAFAAGCYGEETGAGRLERVVPSASLPPRRSPTPTRPRHAFARAPIPMSLPFRSITALGASAILASPAVAAQAADPPLDAPPTATLRTSPSPTVAADAPIADSLRAFASDLRTDRRLAHERRERRQRRAARAAADAGPTGALAAIAQCESGGNPRAIGGGGTYRGMYQFSYATWAAVGGTGDPAAASVAEQTKRAQILYDTAGPSQWPVCGQ